MGNSSTPTPSNFGILDVSKVTKKKKKGILYYIKKDFFLYLLLFIPVTYFVIFKYVPMYQIIVAFKDYDVIDGINGSKWIGLDAFKEVFKMADFYKVLRNTLSLNVLDLILGFPAPIILAILLNEIRIKWFKKVSQTILYLPHFLSWVIIGGMAYQLLSPTGMVNILTKSLGAAAVPFLIEKWHWLGTYCVIGVWQGVGWGTIIYLASITSVNSELYEAAMIDGAGRLKKIWYITLPAIKPTIIMMLILAVGNVMKIGFDRPFVLGNPLVMDFSDVISTFVYRVGLQSVRYNIAAAVGLFQSVIGLVLILFVDRLAKKFGEQGIM
ncbi:ABC transporter permease subunit [Clostridium estertheticum]|uniref:ABC transporter permease n=1 Tax=Clostridium estertheticum TaxID=238834 RepID=UPI001C7CF87F|nr:ABC transporter permease subunit [Clostridium estertheticum]MBX4260949.1 ABC transporter permease subunit [Clostridium estertheticum]WLC71794.1 ABC transporter permease subunit [Clostridium estertheticum]